MPEEIITVRRKVIEELEDIIHKAMIDYKGNPTSAEAYIAIIKLVVDDYAAFILKQVKQQ